ncbi:MAG: hypothetical protein ABSC77_13250 [Terracidiphilus sp.]|jgi:hypothetical protein
MTVKTALYSLYGRGLAEQIKIDQAATSKYIAAAKAIQSDIADQFAQWGVPATKHWCARFS